MDEKLNKPAIKAIDKTIDQSLAEISNSDNILKTYRYILNQKPPKQIVKHHDFGNFDYLPITAVERLLDGLFEDSYFEVKQILPIANGILISGTLHAKIPNSKELIKDGVGFAELQTVKGAAPTDFTKLMQGAGVLAAPKAKAEAIKNAAKSFGNLFGRNLTRKDDNQYLEDTFVNTSRNKIANTLEAKK